jgi:aspartyl-tRNA synthetase
MTYADAMRRFGTDKPDLRFGMELSDLTAALGSTSARVFRTTLDAGGAIVGLRVAGAADMTRRELEEWETAARGSGAQGLVWLAVGDGELRSNMLRHLSDDDRAGILETTGAQPGDLVFLVADKQTRAQKVLGEMRTRIAERRNLIPADRWEFMWLVDPPMFEWDEQTERWDSVNHPFTAPQQEWIDSFRDDPGEALARGYDLVLNGFELGGGSIRIHQKHIQERVFEVLGIQAEEAQERFGFFLRALDFGPPPHGGMAYGLDRVVMLLAGFLGIREVIAFPKTQTGQDLLTGAPAPVDPGQLSEVGLRILAPAAARSSD